MKNLRLFSDYPEHGNDTNSEQNAFSAGDEIKILLYEGRKKSVWIGYLLLFCLNGFFLHRHYIGKHRSALILMLTSFIATWGIFTSFVKPVSKDTLTSLSQLENTLDEDSDFIDALEPLDSEDSSASEALESDSFSLASTGFFVFLILVVLGFELYDIFTLHSVIRKYNHHLLMEILGK